MPTYLLHGFRWSRGAIRIHIILNDLEDAAAEWIVAPNSSVAFLGSFEKLCAVVPRSSAPALMSAVERIGTKEEYPSTNLKQEQAVSSPVEKRASSQGGEREKKGVELGKGNGNGNGNAGEGKVKGAGGLRNGLRRISSSVILRGSSSSGGGGGHPSGSNGIPKVPKIPDDIPGTSRRPRTATTNTSTSLHQTNSATSSVPASGFRTGVGSGSGVGSGVGTDARGAVEKRPDFNDWSKVKLLEQYDPEDLAVSQPFAYVGDYVVKIPLSADMTHEIAKYESLQKQKLSKSQSQETHSKSDETLPKSSVSSSAASGSDRNGNGNGNGESAKSPSTEEKGGEEVKWIEGLRDILEKDAQVGWFVVVCGDEERAAPATSLGSDSDRSESEFDEEEEGDEVEEDPQRTPTKRGLRGFFSRNKSREEKS